MDIPTQRHQKKWFEDHDRAYKENQFVYPVISRRSQGLSIGINLNQNRSCNYQCLYCQVDHKTVDKEPSSPIWLSVIEGELVSLIEEVRTGSLWEDPRFQNVPTEFRTLKDIAFSGNGEPTMAPLFEQVCERLSDWIFPLNAKPKIILITNGSQMHQKSVQRSLSFLQKEDLEVWFKFDTANPDDFTRLHQCKTPLQQVVTNLETTLQQYPTRIQTMIFREQKAEPFAFDKQAYLAVFKKFAEAGLKPLEVQMTTLARATEIKIFAATQRELNEMQFLVQKEFPSWNVETYL